jgi:beta-N-acetylhexosaminidase
LEMRGLMNLYPREVNPSGRAAIDAIKAGADVLMLPQNLDATFDAIVSAVRNNEIPETRIDESVRKILEMKAAAGLNDSRFVDLNVVHHLFPDTAADSFAQHVADEAVTLVRNNGRIIPLALQKDGASDQASKRAIKEPGLTVVSFTDSYNSRVGHEFDRQIKLRRPDTKIFHYYNDHINSDALPSDVLAVVKNGGPVVVAAFVTHVPGRQAISHGRMITAVGLSGESAEFLEDIVATGPQNTVVIALGSPYLILNYPKIETYICTYSLTTTAEVAVAKSLFGEIENHAKLPVTLPSIAEREFFVPWPKQPEGTPNLPAVLNLGRK